MSDEAPISFIPNTEHRSNDFTTIIFRSTLIKGVLLILGCLLILAGFVYWLIVSLNQPPADFPLKQPITIEKGTTVREITRILAEAHVVRSDAFLYYTLVLFYEPSSLKASTYLFSEPLSTTQVAKRLSEGDFDTDLIRFTHFEGERATQIAARASDILPNFNEARFIAAAEPLEGKLFPETYFVPEAFTDEDILNLMFKTFTASIEPLQQKIA